MSGTVIGHSSSSLPGNASLAMADQLHARLDAFDQRRKAGYDRVIIVISSLRSTGAPPPAAP
jgi:hypothetical protein